MITLKGTFVRHMVKREITQALYRGKSKLTLLQKKLPFIKLLVKFFSGFCKLSVSSVNYS